jgi:hypothetical protein
MAVVCASLPWSTTAPVLIPSAAGLVTIIETRQFCRTRSGLKWSPATPAPANGLSVPAADGYNLGCSFCLIQQRGEVTSKYLRPEDFARFIQEAAERSPIFAVSIQGHEPLVPASLPYAQAVLATGRFLGLPTAMVTNGVLLADTLDLLAALAPSKIAISLDAARGGDHVQIRGGGRPTRDGDFGPHRTSSGALSLECNISIHPIGPLALSGTKRAKVRPGNRSFKLVYLEG